MTDALVREFGGVPPPRAGRAEIARA